MKTLSAREVNQILRRNGDFRLIDVLPEEHYRERHIPGSVNVPLEEEEFLERVEDVAGGKDAKVVVYCASTECDASSKATRRLENAGFHDVADFEGGLAEWKRAGFSLEGQEVRA